MNKELSAEDVNALKDKDILKDFDVSPILLTTDLDIGYLFRGGKQEAAGIDFGLVSLAAILLIVVAGIVYVVKGGHMAKIPLLAGIAEGLGSVVSRVSGKISGYEDVEEERDYAKPYPREMAREPIRIKSEVRQPREVIQPMQRQVLKPAANAKRESLIAIRSAYGEEEPVIRPEPDKVEEPFAPRPVIAPKPKVVPRVITERYERPVQRMPQREYVERQPMREVVERPARAIEERPKGIFSGLKEKFGREKQVEPESKMPKTEESQRKKMKWGYGE